MPSCRGKPTRRPRYVWGLLYELWREHVYIVLDKCFTKAGGRDMWDGGKNSGSRRVIGPASSWAGGGGLRGRSYLLGSLPYVHEAAVIHSVGSVAPWRKSGW